MPYKRLSLVGYTFQVTDFDGTLAGKGIFQQPLLFTTTRERKSRPTIRAAKVLLQANSDSTIFSLLL